MDCSPPGSSVHGILQARILEWVAIPFSRRSSWPRDQIQVSCIAAHSLSSEPPGKPFYKSCSNVTFFIRLTLMILFKLSSFSQLSHPLSFSYFPFSTLRCSFQMVQNGKQKHKTHPFLAVPFNLFFSWYIVYPIVLEYLNWNTIFIHWMVSVQFSHSVVSDSVIPWTAARQASLSITNSWSLLKLMSNESVMTSNHLFPCHLLLLLPSILPLMVYSKDFLLLLFKFYDTLNK